MASYPSTFKNARWHKWTPEIPIQLSRLNLLPGSYRCTYRAGARYKETIAAWSRTAKHAASRSQLGPDSHVSLSDTYVCVHINSYITYTYTHSHIYIDMYAYVYVYDMYVYMYMYMYMYM